MKLHTVYKGTLSGVLFALIVQKIPLSNFFYTSTATDASDKYEVWTNALQIWFSKVYFSQLYLSKCTWLNYASSIKAFRVNFPMMMRMLIGGNLCWWLVAGKEKLTFLPQVWMSCAAIPAIPSVEALHAAIPAMRSPTIWSTHIDKYRYWYRKILLSIKYCIDL